MHTDSNRSINSFHHKRKSICITFFCCESCFLHFAVMNKNSIKLGWILYKIIGYASYSLKFKPNYEVPKFYSSKLGAIYNIILTVSVSFVLVKAEVDSHYDKENTTNSLIKIIKSGEAVLGVVAIVTAYLTYVFAQKSIVHVQNYISEIGQAMFLLDHRYKAKNLTKFYLKNILFQLVVCMLLILSQHLAYGLYSTYQNIMMSFLISYFVLQYTSYVTRLSEKLRHLNDLLQALKTDCETKLGFYFNSSVNRLDRLRKLHAVIYSLTKKVADFYSFAMLTTCSYLLVSQTLSIHFVMDTLLNESDDELFVVFMLNNVCWFLAQGGPIVKLTNSIDDLVFEVSLNLKFWFW